MPDPSTAMQRAFAHSFLARNWEDVLEYSLDVNAYLEKLFLTLFARRRTALVDAKQPLLEKRVRTVYEVLMEAPAMWVRDSGDRSDRNLTGTF